MTSRPSDSEFDAVHVALCRSGRQREKVHAAILERAFRSSSPQCGQTFEAARQIIEERRRELRRAKNDANRARVAGIFARFLRGLPHADEFPDFLH